MKSKSREIRNKLGLTKVQTAAIAGIGMNALERIDRGDLRIRIETLFRVALAYGASPSDVWPALGARPKRAMISPQRTRSDGRTLIRRSGGKVSPQMVELMKSINGLKP